jgi:beta-xylosidase
MSQEEEKNEELSSEEFRKIIFENKLKMHGKTYPIITAQDIIDKEAQMCFYCFLHSSHTPCGKQLQKWKDCTLSRPEKSDKEEEEEKDDPKMTVNQNLLLKGRM